MQDFFKEKPPTEEKSTQPETQTEPTPLPLAETNDQEEGSSSQFLYYATINDPDGYTNVRKGKSKQSGIEAVVYDGERFKVLNDEGSWFLVETQNQKIGYMYYDRVKRK